MATTQRADRQESRILAAIFNHIEQDPAAAIGTLSKSTEMIHDVGGAGRAVRKVHYHLPGDDGLQIYCEDAYIRVDAVHYKNGSGDHTRGIEQRWFHRCSLDQARGFISGYIAGHGRGRENAPG